MSSTPATVGGPAPAPRRRTPELERRLEQAACLERRRRLGPRPRGHRHRNPDQRLHPAGDGHLHDRTTRDRASAHHLFDVPLGWGVFAFVVISAAALFTIASPAVFSWYKRNLLQDRNYGRWIEYFFSSSIMIVLISMITGVSDVAALLAIFGVNASMILFGLLMEKYESPGKPSWLSFWFGSSPASSPGSSWRSTCGARVSMGRRRRPSCTASSSACSSSSTCFALNMWLQYHRVGQVAGLPVRREGVHHPEPEREVAAGLVGVLRGAGELRASMRSGRGRRREAAPAPVAYVVSCAPCPRSAQDCCSTAGWPSPRPAAARSRCCSCTPAARTGPRRTPGRGASPRAWPSRTSWGRSRPR